MKKGMVFLVGAGPGDIGLLTVKGLRCLQRADVVVYDYHLNAQVLNYVRQARNSSMPASAAATMR